MNIRKLFDSSVSYYNESRPTEPVRFFRGFLEAESQQTAFGEVVSVRTAIARVRSRPQDLGRSDMAGT